MGVNKWLNDRAGSLKGKRIAISGSTGGIGSCLCKHLALLGASLVLVDRNMEKSSALAKELKQEYPNLSITHICVDMEDEEKVKKAAEELMGLEIDHLILNAGAYHIPRHKCTTGYDNVYQINFVSPYYLASKLLPYISRKNGKVVAVGSIAHNYSHINAQDIDFSHCERASKVYGNAKRFLMYSLWGMEEYTKNISVTHPGITFTNITAHYPKAIFALIKHPMKIIFMTPRKASLCILEGLFCNCEKNEWIGPRFFNIWGLPKKQKLKNCGEDEALMICGIAQDVMKKMDE